jgi:hypothetical protein
VFDWVPTRVSLLVAIAAIAYPALSYLWRYIRISPANIDLTQPRPDFSWRSTRRFAIGACIVLTAIGLAFFIFTPTAEAFAQAPEFLPLLMAALTIFATYSTIKGYLKGEIDPLVRGSFGPFSRAEHPRRYWVSLAWNVFFIALMTWLLFKV